MLSPTQRAVAELLCQGLTLTTTQLIDGLYGDRADGGPETADLCVRVQIHKLRSKLSSVGIEIDTIGYGRGFEGYRLRPDHAAALGALIR